MRLEYFQLIDRIVELDLAGQTIRTEARVPTASTIFEGHFPGLPLMPGVLLIEAMAQTSGWLVIALTRFTRMPFFVALKEAKLRSFVTPGQTLSLSAKLLHEGSGFAVTQADIRCDDKRACNAEITFRLVEFPNPEFRASMDMIVAAGGGERDTAVDSAILTELPRAAKPESYLNERLMSDLRPTLFLAQLSNLLAGNISIVHGVTGSSRTFMGEEGAGADAVRIALARILAGQSELALVGGAHNGERKDLLTQYEFGGYLFKGAYKPVWERAPAGGFAAASLGAFLVIESRAHAQARGAQPLA